MIQSVCLGRQRDVSWRAFRDFAWVKMARRSVSGPAHEVSVIHRMVFHNDRIIPIEQVRLSPGQAGLLSGWGLFTTLRIFQGEAFAYERHWRRLEKDAARTRLPFHFEAARVRMHLRELLRANQAHEGTARIYILYNK